MVHQGGIVMRLYVRHPRHIVSWRIGRIIVAPRAIHRNVVNVDGTVIRVRVSSLHEMYGGV